MNTHGKSLRESAEFFRRRKKVSASRRRFLKRLKGAGGKMLSPLKAVGNRFKSTAMKKLLKTVISLAPCLTSSSRQSILRDVSDFMSRKNKSETFIQFFGVWGGTPQQMNRNKQASWFDVVPDVFINCLWKGKSIVQNNIYNDRFYEPVGYHQLFCSRMEAMQPLQMESGDHEFTMCTASLNEAPTADHGLKGVKLYSASEKLSLEKGFPHTYFPLTVNYNILPSMMPLWYVRAPYRNWITKVRVKPPRGQEATWQVPWVECMSPVCNSAMRFNAPECQREDGKLVKPESQSSLLEKCSKLDHGPPTCASKMKIDITYCNTCCCRQGLAGVNIKHALVMGTSAKCGTWMAAVDTLGRVMTTVLRLAQVADLFTRKCFI